MSASREFGLDNLVQIIRSLPGTTERIARGAREDVAAMRRGERPISDAKNSQPINPIQK